ncbi:MAG: DUF5702 domain-containing protein, partial [Bacillota bacterium]|nr:DUF5702 domain-containing protein [Bacillota bacterium]
MAYFGSEREINTRLNYYTAYSFEGKMDATVGRASSTLEPYVLADPENFVKAIKLSLPEGIVSEIVNADHVKRSTGDSHRRVLANKLVIDTLPSEGIKGGIDIKDIGRRISENGLIESIGETGGNYAVEMAYIRLHLGNHLYAADNKAAYFMNEWEYVIEGKYSDEDNYSGCRNKIFILRNILNLAALLKDAEKMTAIAEIAELITPGPAALITQGIIAEAWAAAEAESDVRTLLDYGRVPLIKGPEQWKIGLGEIFDSGDLEELLDEDGKKLLVENGEAIHEKIDELGGAVAEFKDGQSYEDYLMMLMVSMNDNVRLLRIMDILQINMKYRYYRDFNMEEYYIGTDIAIETNG